MNLSVSHDRKRILWAVIGGVALVGFFVLAAGKWEQIQNRRSEGERVHRLEALNTQLQNELGRTLTEIKARAFELNGRFQQKLAPAFGDGPILYWAKLQLKENARVLAVARSSLLKTEGESGQLGFEWVLTRNYEQHLLRVIQEKVREGAQNISPGNNEDALFIRLKKDSQYTREWLAIVFANGTVNNSKEFIAVLVEPQKTFENPLRVGNGLLAMNQRAYLMGRDGSVLAHSLESFSGADFSEMLKKTRLAHSRVGLSADRMKSQLGLYALARTPFLIGVEEWLPPVSKNQLRPWEAVLLLGALGFLILGLGAVGLGLARPLYRTVQARKDLKRPIHELPPVITAPVEVRVLPEVPSLILEEKTSDSARQESKEELVQALGQEHPDIENEFFTSLTQDDRTWQKSRFDKITMAQFELNVADATQGKNVEVVARRCIEGIQKLFGLQSLFFVFNPKTKMATLQITSGRLSDSSVDAGAFPLDERILADLSTANPAEQSRLLAAYPPFRKAMLLLGNSTEYRAWVFRRTHFIQYGSFLGLVVVQGNSADLERAFGDDSLIRVLETSNLAYEFTLHSDTGMKGL